MATYLELRAKGEKLLAEAEELRTKELNDVIKDIKQKMQVYGLTAQDLELRGSVRQRRKNGSNGKAKPKYRGPNGETWGGGRGRKPKWITEVLASGKKLEEFAV